MISAAPTIVALQTDSAWVVVVAVSVVTFPLVVLLRRLIARPGGVMSGVLLVLPLVLPLVAAFTFQSAVFPEIAVLRPAGPSLAGDPHVLLLSLSESQLLIPYRLSGISGVWLLAVAGAASCLMLVRRFVCAAAARRLMTRCVPAGPDVEERATRIIGAVSDRLGVAVVPALHLLPGDRDGIFCSRRGGGQIFISRQLLDCLSDDELTGVLAHEVAHLAARDTAITFFAGLLRDMVVWNPVAHLAHRRLLSDRELEADRVAASVTGPLPVASGLVKVCETLGSRRTLAQSGALAFLRPSGAIKRRVRALLAMADGAIAVEPGPRMIYVLAALLVATVGLQVGAQLAQEHQQRPPFTAIFLGAPHASSVEAWPTTEELAVQAQAKRKKVLRPQKVRKQAQRMAREARIASITGAVLERPYGFREEELRRWLNTIAAVTALRGGDEGAALVELPPIAWRADFPRHGFGPISVVRIHEQNLERKEARGAGSSGGGGS